MSLAPRPEYQARTLSESYEDEPFRLDDPQDASPMIDLYGAILRRKFLVLVFAVVGAGLGYLFFTRETPIYSSALKLMIWVQAPPSMVNGDTVVQTVSLPKQQNLLASELVLSGAIRKGQLDKAGVLSGGALNVPMLKGMIKVAPVDKGNSDALMLSIQGPVAADLPIILEYIVSAYTSILEDDTAIAGKESVSLVEKLQTRLLEDQKTDQANYQALLRKLNLTTSDERGVWVNPNARTLSRLITEREAVIRDLRECDLVFEQAKTVLESKIPRSEVIHLIAIEARRYLHLQEPQAQPVSSSGLSAEQTRTLERLSEKAERLAEEREGLEFEKNSLLKSLGPNHVSVLALQKTLDFKVTLHDRAVKDLKTYQSSLAEKAESPEENKEAAPEKATEMDTIRLYATALSRDRERLRSSKQSFDQEIEVLERESLALAGDMAELNILKTQIEDRRVAVSEIIDKLSAISVVSNNYTTTKVRVIDSAKMGAQTYPKLFTFLAFGTMIASVLGLVLAIVVDHSDLSFRTPLQIHENLRIPVICKIPRIPKAKAAVGSKVSTMLIAAHKTNSIASEAFRSGRTALMFAAGRIQGNVFLFTSPSPGDGKSTMTGNLAISLAQAGKRVLLIDADYRRPRVHQNFGISIEPGFCDTFEGKPLEECIRPSGAVPQLDLLTTGGRPKDPGEIVSSKSFHLLLEQMREKYDYVLVDSPPLLPVADAASISTHVDGVILVLRIRRGVMVASQRAKEQLELVNARILGVIVNGLDQNPYYSDYGYYSSYGYQKGYGRYHDSQNVLYQESTAKA